MVASEPRKMTVVAPSAQGTLVETPLSHLLVYALDHRLEGTLVIEEPGQRRHAVYFSAGAPTIVHSADPVIRLGDLLVRQGALAASAVEPAVVRARAARKLLGASLIESGAITEEALMSALVEQMAQTLLYLHARPGESAFGYYDGINYLERLEPIAIKANPFPLIWRLFRDAADERRVVEVVNRLGEGSLRLHVAAPIAKFGFEPRVQAVVDVLRAKPQPWVELNGRSLVSESTLRRLLYMLCMLRHLDLPGTAPPVGAHTTPPPGSLPLQPAASRSSSPAPGRTSTTTPAHAVPAHAAPPPKAAQPPATAPTSPSPGARPRLMSSPEADALRAEIKRRAEDTSASYYEILGVPQDATPATIQAAFFQLAKTLHPDRLSPELADVRDLASRVFARLSEAHQVLGDPRRRQEYDSRMQNAENGEDQEQVQRVLRAATAYQKALVLLKRQSLEAAEQEAKLAAETDPEQADYIGLLAWIQSMKPNADLPLLVVKLDKAVDMEENNLRVRWYRGQLLKRLGKEGRAQHDFRFILERDPKHVDAQREVRLFEMRRASGKGKSDPPGRSSSRPPLGKGSSVKPNKTSKPPGVLGRLFKKQ
jgi:curved DNA-binding protein CbpA